ncbi:MAG TPA: Crp/Fnr family transcriptional regulator [Vitreimonas sp.]|uniref:Crp/Fnr family transcriptional regulator n=1 Tax=Vitreimonas sp. TaxID=3069702 RepID=UPI002D43B2C4|nr:Crp/Fnr family transcriptional regulator [Vitreimonas sp.]HYD87777.1 Crp/Fnr family transcriptional regulator [Vitreimonas sp.]
MSAADIELLHALPLAETWPAGAELHAEAAPPQPRVLLSGWAARFRMLRDGRRQIISFILPGDGIGVCERPSPLTLTATTTLTAVRTADASAVVAALHAGTHPALRDAVRSAIALDERCLIDHVVRNGRQTAQERICHLLMELRWRLLLSGAIEGYAMPWPLTQEMIADALGLSIVHVNRMLQHMRRDGQIEARHGVLTLLQPGLIAELAEFRAPPLTS